MKFVIVASDVVVDTMIGAPLSSTGFVTFTDLVTLTYAVRAPITHEAGVLQVAMAPDPRDIVWHNAHVNQSWKSGREWTANVFLCVGAILWSIPVTGIQALANLDEIGECNQAQHLFCVCRPANFFCSKLAWNGLGVGSSSR